MTISTASVRNDYTNTSGGSTFPYTFKIFDDSDVEVYTLDSSGTSTKKTLTTDYTVSGVGSSSGGNVVFVSPVPAGTEVHIVAVLDRSSSGTGIALTQTTDLVNETGFFQDRIEDRFDILCRQTQVVANETARALKITNAATLANYNLDLPAPKAGYIIGSTNGTSYDNIETVSASDAIAGNWTVNSFVTGVGFTAGTSTSVVLSKEPASAQSILVFFDGVAQHRDTYSVAGTALNFTSTIPNGVSNVEVRIPATLAVGDLPDGAVEAALVAATGSTAQRGVGDRFADVVNVKDFGAMGDGITNDAASVVAAVEYAKTVDKSVFFPSGTYLVTGMASLSGRVSLTGSPLTAKIKGGLTYDETAMPSSANVATYPSYATPFFSCHGIDFENPSGAGLTVKVQESTEPLNVCHITQCEFYGDTGLTAINLIGFRIASCRFLVKRTGINFLGCTNGTVANCHFYNQASFGVRIAYTTSGTAFRGGGENIKFIACEWLVCQFGLWAVHHQWGVLEGCLFDYCTVPCFIEGCQNFKASKTYFGASTTMVTLGSGWVEYSANVSTGIAMWVRPFKTPSLATIPSSGTFENCEFIDYTGNDQPIVYSQGQPAGFAGTQVQQLTFLACLFLVSANHSKPYLFVAEYTTKLMLSFNRFQAPANNPTTIISPYSFANCDTVSCVGNDSWNVLNASLVSVRGQNETLDFGQGTVGPDSIRIASNKVTFSGAVPNTGTWSVGDVTFNINAAIGQPKGWRCTVAGTPGTWVSEGNL